MNRWPATLFFVLVGVGLLLMRAVPPAVAQSPTSAATSQGTAFTYQGQLSDGGSPANGNYDFQFKLYNAASGGSLVGSTVTKSGVAVSDGLFTVQLDFGNVFDGTVLWLEIAVKKPSDSSYTTLGRQALTATPYAAYALKAPWSGLTGVPADFADGVDDDTTYTAGTGLTLSGTQFSLDTGYTDGRYWKVGGNNLSGEGTLGTTSNKALNVVVNNQRALRLEPTAGTPNLSAGYFGNTVTFGVAGATIGGGGSANTNCGAGGDPCINEVTDNYGTVGGGYDNQAGDRAGTITDAGYATVGGGRNNIASGEAATVGGGALNTASGSYATVGGGFGNKAAGDYSFAAGQLAQANHDGTFVWADNSTNISFSSTAANQFLVRAAGGARFEGGGQWDLGNTEGDFRIGNDTYRLKIGVSYGGSGAGDVWLRAHGGTGRMIFWTKGVKIFSNDAKTTGVELPANSGSWSSLSDRFVKANMVPVDPLAVLEKVADLPVSTWNYIGQPESVRHMGPTAQDFYAAFGLGESETHIATIDADGVALAAIQGLYQQVQELEAENRALREENADQQAQIDTLWRENGELQAQIEEIQAQLAELSASSGSRGTVRPVQSGLLPGFGTLLVGLVLVGAVVYWQRKGGGR